MNMGGISWRYRSTVILVIAIHVTCFGFWSVQGFLVPSMETTRIVASPLSLPSGISNKDTTILKATDKDNPNEDQEKQGRTKRFLKFFQGDKKDEDSPDKKPKKAKERRSGESVVVRLVRRVTKKKDDDDGTEIDETILRASASQGESVVVRLFKRVMGSKKKEEDVVAELINEKQVPEVLPLSFFKSIIQSGTFQDAVESGDLTPEAEQRIINELRRGAELKRKQQQVEQQKRKEEQQAKAQAKKEAEKLAVERAKEKRLQQQKQKELLERQKKIQQAATAAAKGTSAAIPVDETNREKSGSGTRKYASAAQKFFKGVMDNFGKEEEWIVVGPKTILAPGEIVPVTAGGLDLLVVASKDGKRLYCIANSCPHLGTPLETGLLEQRPAIGAGGFAPTADNIPSEDCIVCPLHRTAFSLKSGEVRGEWSPFPPVIGAMMAAVKTETPVAVFDVRARGKNIEVRINSSLDEMGNKAVEKEKSKSKKQ